jgi:hypothetical protein
MGSARRANPADVLVSEANEGSGDDRRESPGVSTTGASGTSDEERSECLLSEAKQTSSDDRRESDGAREYSGPRACNPSAKAREADKECESNRSKASVPTVSK